MIQTSDDQPLIAYCGKIQCLTTIKIMAKKHYAEVAGNYKKFAEVLSAEANEIEGMAGVRFDDSTVGRWMKD